MLKTIRWLLYGLGISTGLAGLVVGGTPLAKFAIEWLHDHEYGYYYDPNFLFSPEVVFILSVILLVFVHISFLVGKGIHVAGQEKSGSPVKPVENSTAPADKNSPPSAAAAAATSESVDEKLARLLNEKKN